jgi:hypothetical protein
MKETNLFHRELSFFFTSIGMTIFQPRACAYACVLYSIVIAFNVRWNLYWLADCLSSYGGRLRRTLRRPASGILAALVAFHLGNRPLGVEVLGYQPEVRFKADAVLI